MELMEARSHIFSFFINSFNFEIRQSPKLTYFLILKKIRSLLFNITMKHLSQSIPWKSIGVTLARKILFSLDNYLEGSIKS